MNDTLTTPKITQTTGGYPITDFKKLDPPVKWGSTKGNYALPDFVYEGQVDIPKYGKLTIQWTGEGKCSNYSRKDCFINLEF